MRKALHVLALAACLCGCAGPAAGPPGARLAGGHYVMRWMVAERGVDVRRRASVVALNRQVTITTGAPDGGMLTIAGVMSEGKLRASGRHRAGGDSIHLELHGSILSSGKANGWFTVSIGPDHFERGMWVLSRASP